MPILLLPLAAIRSGDPSPRPTTELEPNASHAKCEPLFTHLPTSTAEMTKSLTSTFGYDRRTHHARTIGLQVASLHFITNSDAHMPRSQWQYSISSPRDAIYRMITFPETSATCLRMVQNQVRSGSIVYYTHSYPTSTDVLLRHLLGPWSAHSTTHLDSTYSSRPAKSDSWVARGAMQIWLLRASCMHGRADILLRNFHSRHLRLGRFPLPIAGNASASLSFWTVNNVALL